jgi:hypothetical protein
LEFWEGAALEFEPGAAFVSDLELSEFGEVVWVEGAVDVSLALLDSGVVGVVVESDVVDEAAGLGAGAGAALVVAGFESLTVC